MANMSPLPVLSARWVQNVLSGPAGLRKPSPLPVQCAGVSPSLSLALSLPPSPDWRPVGSALQAAWFPAAGQCQPGSPSRLGFALLFSSEPFNASLAFSGMAEPNLSVFHALFHISSLLLHCVGPLALFYRVHPSWYFPSTLRSRSQGFWESCWLALFTILITAKDFLPAVGWIMVGWGGGGSALDRSLPHRQSPWMEDIDASPSCSSLPH